MTTREEVKEVASDVARWWWLWMVAGIAWIFVAMIILQLDAASVRTVGFIVGAMLFVAGIQYLLIAMVAVALAAVLQALIQPVFPLRVQVPTRAFWQIPLVAIVASTLAAVGGMRKVASSDPAKAFAGGAA